MTGLKSFQSYPSVEAAERGERQASELEIRSAINNHAENLEHLNAHHETMHAAVTRLNDQMDAVLDSLTQINRRLDALEAIDSRVKTLEIELMSWRNGDYQKSVDLAARIDELESYRPGTGELYRNLLDGLLKVVERLNALEQARG